LLVSPDDISGWCPWVVPPAGSGRGGVARPTVEGVRAVTGWGAGEERQAGVCGVRADPGTYVGVGRARGGAAGSGRGCVFKVVRRYAVVSQHRLAAAVEMPQSRINRLVNGRGGQVLGLEVWERIAEGLGMPDTARLAVGLAPLGPGEARRCPALHMPCEAEETDPMDRRQALRSLGAAAGVGATGVASLDSSEDRQALLGAVAAITVGAVPADLDRWLPSPTAAQGTGTVTAEMVETITAVTTAHRLLDSSAGGGAALGSANGYLTWAVTLLGNPCESPGVATGLRSAVAELHSLVGWAAHDLRGHDLARRHLTQALALARQADDLPLMAYVLFQLGRASLEGQDQGGAADALHVLALGRYTAQQSGCRAIAAILHGDTAWAYAQLGEADQVSHHLARTRHERELADIDASPAWARYAVSEADGYGRSGVVHATLARHAEHRTQAVRAGEDMHAAIALRPADQRRSQVFDLIYLTSACLLTEEFADATRYCKQATTLAEAGMQSVRVVDRLTSMLDLATPHLEAHPDLAVFGPRIDSLRAQRVGG
jgi:hypothetical protein